MFVMYDKKFRLNVRVSPELNAWLDEKSSEMGISKSSLVAMAIANYRVQLETVDVVKKLEKIGNKLLSEQRQ